MREIVAIIQARLSSSRLPGKVLQDIDGKTMLEWVVNRTRKSEFVNDVIVAITTDPSDDDLFIFCKEKDFHVRRGSVYDVLDRYYQTAKEIEAEIIVRITADCPFMDPELIDDALRLLQGDQLIGSRQKNIPTNSFDFVANRLPHPWGRSYPIGLDVEVFTWDILEDAWRKATEQYQREHVAPYFYEDASVDDLKYKDSLVPYAWTITPKGHCIALLHNSPNYGHLRWTVDTPEDLDLVRIIASEFGDMDFSWHDILVFMQKNPALYQINAHVSHRTHLDVDHRST